jgi:molecular chaperone DnaK
MLDKKDVDRMVHEATEHAAEDKKRREEVETRNQAEALTFQAERTLKDLGDKVTPEDRAAVEGKVSDVRNALKTETASVVQARATELAELLQKVGTAAYAAAGTPSGDGAGGSSGDADGQPGATPAAEDETVEGEFKEV